MSIEPTATVAQIVAEYPRCAAVFEKYGIDYCCHGNIALAVACRERAHELGALTQELEVAARRDEFNPDDKDVRSLSVPALVARIVDRHHGYLRTALPFLAQLCAKVAKAHGDREPALVELAQTFADLERQIGPHLDLEERELFPELVAHRPADRSKIRTDLEAMFAEHLAVGELLRKVRALASDYATPIWACNAYSLLMSELQKLESDVLRHIHLENHVLMPRFTQ